MDLRKIKYVVCHLLRFVEYLCSLRCWIGIKKIQLCHVALCFAWLTAAELAMNVVESFCIAERLQGRATVNVNLLDT